MSAMQRQLIRFSLEHMAFLEEQILELDEEMNAHIGTSELQHQHEILQTVPAVKRAAVSGLLAEFGPDMKVFGSGAKCSAWARKQ
jgi:transposase